MSTEEERLKRREYMREYNKRPEVKARHNAARRTPEAREKINAKKREYMRIYREENRDKIRQLDKNFHENHKAERNELHREYYEKHKDVIIARAIEFNKKNAKAARDAKKSYLLDQLGHKCSRCGYSNYDGALEFHHKNGRTEEERKARKSPTLRGWDYIYSIVPELIVLCANCHREVHRDNYGKQFEGENDNI